MKIIADTHTHSLACDHAYSTIIENCREASEQGLRVVCTTEHAPAMPGAPTFMYFVAMDGVTRTYKDVYILRGVELNVLDMAGNVDLAENFLKIQEWVIASIHITNYTPSSIDAHTQTWLNVAKNPYVHVIGHCGDERFRFDYEAGIKAFKENGKIVEINSHSMDVRPGSAQNCREIALLCKQYKVPIVVSSDAHFATNVGSFDNSLRLLEEIDFPEELVLNANYNRFASFVNDANSTILLPLDE